MRALLAALFWLALTPPCFAQARDPRGGEEASRLAATFAQAFIMSNSQDAVGVMHPALSKLGVWRNLRNSGRDGVLALPPGALDILAASHNRDGRLSRERTRVTVDVLDSTTDVGVVRLTVGDDWYDYYLAARVGGRWSIVNGVFGAASELAASVNASDRQAAITAVQTYAAAATHGTLAGAHLDFTSRAVDPVSGLLIVETRDTFNRLAPRPAASGAPSVRLLAIAPTTAAALVVTAGYAEWVFLLRLDGAWRPVSSFWSPVA